MYTQLLSITNLKKYQFHTLNVTNVFESPLILIISNETRTVNQSHNHYIYMYCRRRRRQFNDNQYGIREEQVLKQNARERVRQYKYTHRHSVVSDKVYG